MSPPSPKKPEVTQQLIVEGPEAPRRFPLSSGENLIGTHESCEVVLEDPTVSRFHAVLLVTDGGVQVADLDSENGTLVAGRRLRGRVTVAVGSELTFGGISARLAPLVAADARIALSTSTTTPTENAAAAAPAAESSKRSNNVPPSASTTSSASQLPATLSTGPIQRLTLGHLPRLASALAEGATAAQLAVLIGEALVNTLAPHSLEIVMADAVLFRYRNDVTEGPSVARAGAVRGPLSVAAVFASQRPALVYSSLLEAMADLLVTAGRGPEAGAEPKSRRWAQATARPEPPTLDPGVDAIYDAASRVAAGTVNVLILGNSGVGKEVLARYVHRASSRSDRPFVALNCAALPSDLLEAELFGIEKGVATGVEARAGVFEQAHGGTLFLDEIGDMEAATQARILRCLQEGEVHRLGASRARPADARVLSATNRDLDALLASGSFRSDLYHRIADWVVRLPDLAERPRDLPQFVSYFLDRETRRLDKHVRGVSEAALDRLCAVSWPGNVRQLEREISRAVLFVDDGGILDTAALSDRVRGDGPATGDHPTTLKEQLASAEGELIRKAVALAAGDVAVAAARLGVPRSTIYRRIKQLGIQL